jgi:hypothetical protein
LWCECWEDFADSRANGFDRSGGGFSQQVLELGEDLLDGVEVGRIFWKEEELGPGGADELAHGFAFVAAEIVDDDDVTGAKRRHEDVLDIDPEALAVDRTFTARRCGRGATRPGKS